MANFGGHIFNKKQSLEREVKDAFIRITGNGAANPTVVSAVGSATIVRNSAGDYTITLSDKYSSMKSLKATVLNATAVDLRVQVKSEAVSDTKQISFLTLTGAVATDLPANSELLIKLELKNAQGF